MKPATQVFPEMSAVLEDLASQPVFFDNKGKPSASLERYTGARATTDEARCDLASALRMIGCSDREIAAAVRCDVRLIPRMLRASEQRGRIPALKERLTELVGQCAEDSALLVKRLVAEGLEGKRSLELAAMLKAAGQVNSFQIEKVQLLTGAATEIIEIKDGRGREEIEAFARSWALPIEVEVAPVNLQSGVSAKIAEGTAGIEGDGHTTDTPGRQSDQSDQSDQATGANADSGGGVSPRGAGRNHRWVSSVSKFIPMADHNENEWIAEGALADHLKVDRSTLRQERTGLLMGEVEQKNGAVMWLKSAAARVSARLGLATAFAPEKPAPAPTTVVHETSADGVETLTVINRALNPNIVNAQRASGERVAVRVMDNRKYVPLMSGGEPMTMQARRSQSGTWWTLVGREPRWPGKW